MGRTTWRSRRIALCQEMVSRPRLLCAAPVWVVEERSNMPQNSIYANPRVVTDIDECFFYHTMDIPGYGVVKGLFDLRDGVQDYLGRVDFKGKRVLELGTADGFLCFYMESKGAEVVAYDLSEDQPWDMVPLCSVDRQKAVAALQAGQRKMNNAFWFSHRAFKSEAKMVYGTVYAIPREIGMVDVATFGAILLHVRDPFLALQNALRLTRETVIITDSYEPVPHILSPKLRIPRLLYSISDRVPVNDRLRHLLRPPVMEFFPTPPFTSDPLSSQARTWWRLSPECIERMIQVCGFEKVSIDYHWQKNPKGAQDRLWTIVGHRTQDHYDY